MRFWEGEIGIVTDIEKAFLRVFLSDECRDCQRFLWIDKMPPTKFKVFRNKTVCFGVKPSPFLLAATIRHHIKKYEMSNPTTFQILNGSLYVDDLIVSINSVDKAKLVSEQAKNILSSADMNLRDFKTNNIQLRNHWKESGLENCESKDEVVIKVLGCVWDTRSDTLKFDVREVVSRIKNTTKHTKRQVFRISCGVFDSVGALLPFTIRMKILLKALC